MNCLQDPKNPDRIHVSRIFGYVEADLYMALSRQIVNFIRLDRFHDGQDAAAVTHIPVMEDDSVQQMLDSSRIRQRTASRHSMNLIAFLQQQLCQIGTVLPGNARNQCLFHK